MPGAVVKDTRCQVTTGSSNQPAHPIPLKVFPVPTLERGSFTVCSGARDTESISYILV